MDLPTIETVLRPRDRDALGEWRPGDAWLAGGTWLFSEPQPGLRRLVDLRDLGWPAHVLTPEGLTLAATCTIAALDRIDLPPAWIAAPLVGQCCRALLGSFKIWNTATVGGNLCLALPAGPMIALGAALDGICTLWSAVGGERTIPVADFVLGPRHNALAPGEVLRSLHLPAAALARRTAFRRISLSPNGRSGALLVGTRDGRALTLTVTASVPHPVRLAFPDIPTPGELTRVLDETIPETLYYDDLHGRPAWRRRVTRHLAAEIRDELAEERP